MFNSLSGKITHKGSNSLRILTGGVEWELEASPNTISSAPGTGNSGSVLVYLHHSQDSLKLYGFSEENERFLFLELLKVSGIGPRQALRILSGSSPDLLIGILESGDADALSRVPGIGKKTAQKILLALQGKLTMPGDSCSTGPYSDIVESLHEMGYAKKAAEEAVAATKREMDREGTSFKDPETEEKEIFRRALLNLA